MARAEDDTEVERSNWHWRNTMRPVRFFHLDARAGLPFCILLFHFRISTLVLTIILTYGFNFLEKKGLTFPAAMRAFRSWVIGSSRPAWISIRHRKFREFK